METPSFNSKRIPTKVNKNDKLKNQVSITKAYTKMEVPIMSRTGGLKTILPAGIGGSKKKSPAKSPPIRDKLPNVDIGEEFALPAKTTLYQTTLC